MTGVVVAGLLAGTAVIALPPGSRGGRAAPATRQPPPGRAARCAVPDVVLIDLVCAALAAGLPTASAVAAAQAASGGSSARDLGGPAAGRADAPQLGGVGRALHRSLALAERTGASVALLLQRAAADERAARRRAVATATGRLGVRLVVPLGLTVLPAFVLLGVVPVVLGLGRQILLSP